jgi:hypothetical protein
MVLLLGMTMCWFVYETLAYRIHTTLKEHGALFPAHQGQRMPHPTTRWVLHDCVGMHVLSIPGQGLMILNLTNETSTSSNS